MLQDYKQDKFKKFFNDTYSKRYTILKDLETNICIKSAGKEYCRRLFVYNTPYNENFVIGIKKLKSYVWNPDERTWSVPVSQKEALLTLCDECYGSKFMEKWNAQKAQGDLHILQLLNE